MEVAATLTQPFPGAILTPCSGWSRVTFNGVLALDPKSGTVYSDDCLLEEIKCNPICTNLHYVFHPRWVCPPNQITGMHSTFSFVFLDPEGSITQTMAHTHLAMFGKAITFKKWQPRPPLMQCLCCHKFGHLLPYCPLPKDAVCCHIYGGNHHLGKHVTKCALAANHATLATCNCPIKCINCNQPGHLARDATCPAQEAYKTLAHDIVKATPPP